MPQSQASDKARPSRLPAAYAALHANFQWQVPEYFNMAQACSAALGSAARCYKKSSCSRIFHGG